MNRYNKSNMQEKGKSYCSHSSQTLAVGLRKNMIHLNISTEYFFDIHRKI